jgi:hypothetical protein
MHLVKKLLEFVPGRKRFHLRREFHRKAEDCTELVNALYRLAFGRVADEAGLAGNAARLEAGTPLEVLAEDLVRSDEFRSRHGPSQSVDCEYLTALYRDGLGRGPDPQALASWLAEGRKGATRAQVLAAMARSNEALEKACPGGSDSTSQPQGAHDSLLVNSLYKTAFGRLADESAFAGNVARLRSGTPLDVLAEDLVRSDEFRDRHGPSQVVDSEYVTALYRDGLGRKPDPEGLAFWLTEGAKGATRAQVLTGVAGSDEALSLKSEAVTARAEILLAPIPRSANIIEIGPSYNPIAPKVEGWNTRTLDHATREELMAKYRGHPRVDISRIEEVDFVWTQGLLSEAVPMALHGTFDAFIASHVIEHTPDLIAFLEAAAVLLKPEGIVALAIPDKRYCFDYFQPLTTTGQLLAAHAEGRSRHSRRFAFDHIAYAVESGGAGAWGQHPSGQFRFYHTIEQARDLFASTGAREDYVDLHAWRFTPTSFELLLVELARLGQTDWRVERITPANGCEFFAWLRRGGAAAAGSLTQTELAAQRLALLKRTLTETKEQIHWLLAAESGPVTVPKVVLPSTAISYAIDQFSIFNDVLYLKGWAFHPDQRVSNIDFISDGKRAFSLQNFNLDSPDVAAAHGGPAGNARFCEVRQLIGDQRPRREASLSVVLSDGSEIVIPSIGQTELRNEPVYTLYRKFLEHLQSMTPGRFLEIGSRARSKIVRKHLIPESWHYTGFDILAGENVDVVGDAHHLSKFLPHGHFRAMWALSVLEHILMPWKLAIELNRVMELGGIGYLATHQTWPLHDRPWDFWRFSSDAWKGLLNDKTGFEIIDVQVGESAFVVANRWHPVVDFGDVGYLASAVMFTKVSETTLNWDVDPAELLVEPYPT